VPANVYTVRIWSGVLSGALPPIFSGEPPAGFIWVVRDVSIINQPGNSSVAGTSPAYLSVAGLPIVATPVTSTVKNVTYEWHDLRAVVGGGDVLELNSLVSFWAWRVDGYQLSLP
jgi:hypothetical protein